RHDERPSCEEGDDTEGSEWRDRDCQYRYAADTAVRSARTRRIAGDRQTAMISLSAREDGCENAFPLLESFHQPGASLPMHFVTMLWQHQK
ncbi:hypothetical protein, partial [Microbacterium sp. B35-04]|uniref:hypothetical protein n=1 Tax=Microbacterium sp. B35-04 TaxID=1961716 RepID=UPI0019545CB5